MESTKGDNKERPQKVGRLLKTTSYLPLLLGKSVLRSNNRCHKSVLGMSIGAYSDLVAMMVEVGARNESTIELHLQHLRLNIFTSTGQSLLECYIDLVQILYTLNTLVLL